MFSSSVLKPFDRLRANGRVSL